MKVKVSIVKEIEVEVGEAVEKLDEWYRTHDYSVWSKVPDDLILKATKEVEKATGLSFGDGQATETITSVIAMDDTPIMEW